MDQPSLDSERRYLDELLNKRFHFYVLLISALGAGLLTQEDLGSRRAQALFALGFLASLGLSVIILRSAALLKVVLDMIIGARSEDGAIVLGFNPIEASNPPDPEHPYRIANRVLRNDRLSSANAIDVIRLAVMATTGAILVGLIWSLFGAPDPADWLG